jgi:hypothetical protein
MIPEDWAAGTSLAIVPETGAAWPELAAMQVKRTPATSDNPTKRFIELSFGFTQTPLPRDELAAYRFYFYFFRQDLVAESHFMSVSFLHSALVFGASAANAGAVMLNRRPATIAVLRILDIVFPSK